MFKLALNAGHYKHTAGKRCHPSIDPDQTREWTLNDRICDKLEKILSEYDGIEVLRTDDTTGETDVSLSNRSAKANGWGADLYLSIHHNAAGKLFGGGGIVAYVYTSPTDEELMWQKELYNAAVKSTGLYGNRSTPLARKNLHEVRETKMPAVLMECGFMDSTVDCPIILTEIYADKTIVATGRRGAEWLEKICSEHDIAHLPGTVDIGVRVEVRNEVMEEVNEVLYESKLIGYPRPFKNKVRTFCQNPGGFVSQ
jgi:N-acetylmuramoyl-L-alanine amidase